MQKNKINIIFLDVDGVLNSRAYLNNHKDPEDEIDMRAVERLAKIYRQCNCKIVLSSSWRELCGDEMKAPHSMYKYLESCLAKYGMLKLLFFVVFLAKKLKKYAKSGILCI